MAVLEGTARCFKTSVTIYKSTSQDDINVHQHTCRNLIPLSYQLLNEDSASWWQFINSCGKDSERRVAAISYSLLVVICIFSRRLPHYA